MLSLSLSLSLTEKMEQFTERDDDDDVLFFLQKKALSTPDEAYFLPSFSVFFRYLFFFFINILVSSEGAGQHP